MTTYNRGSLIRESIQSVINQTYHHWELIVVDDGSTDGTKEIIRNFNDDRIKYLYTEHTGFLGKAKNIGLRQVAGDLIAFQDSDDLWRPDKLEFQMKLLKNNPEAFFVLSNGHQFGEFATSTPDYDNLFVGNLFLPVLERSKYCFYSTSLIFKKEVIRKTGLMDESTPFMRDLHFFLRMSQKFDGIFTNEKLVNVRKHSENISNTFLVDAHLNSLKIFEDLHNEGSLSKKQLRYLSALCFYKIGLYYLNQNEAYKATEHFSKYTALRPLHYKGWIRFFQSISKGLFGKTAAAT